MPRAETSDGRRTRWDAHRAERRAQLVEAALSALDEVGPDFSIDEVAERAGVTKPVVYRHFADRAGLVDAIGLRAVDMLLGERLVPAIALERPLRQVIRDVIAEYVDGIAEYPNVYRFFAHHQPAEGDSLSRTTKDLVAEVVAGILREALVSGGRDPESADVWAHGLVGFVQNVAEWWLDHRTMSAAQIVDHLTELVWVQIDGFARKHGVIVDPASPLDLEDIAEQAMRARGMTAGSGR